jgi:hypothetical protein
MCDLAQTDPANCKIGTLDVGSNDRKRPRIEPDEAAMRTLQKAPYSRQVKLAIAETLIEVSSLNFAEFTK